MLHYTGSIGTPCGADPHDMSQGMTTVLRNVTCPQCANVITRDHPDIVARDGLPKHVKHKPIPMFCFHGDASGVVAAKPDCDRCGGSGLVPWVGDEYPPGTNACCCTCRSCRIAEGTCPK